MWSRVLTVFLLCNLTAACSSSTSATRGTHAPGGAKQGKQAQPGDAFDLCALPAVTAAVHSVSSHDRPCVPNAPSSSNVGTTALKFWAANWAHETGDLDTDGDAHMLVEVNSSQSGAALRDSDQEAALDSSGAPYLKFVNNAAQCWAHWFDGGEVACARGHVLVRLSVGLGTLGDQDRDQFLAAIDAAFSGM